MPDTYITERKLSAFTAEHHLSYRAECPLGDELTLCSSLVGFGPKTIHVAAVMLNRTRQQIACVMESILVNVDFELRKSTPFPDDVVAALELAKADVLERLAGAELPLSGTVGIRQSR